MVVLKFSYQYLLSISKMIDDEPKHVQEDRVQKENASDTIFIKFE